jgi:hypothetical protein
MGFGVAHWVWCAHGLLRSSWECGVALGVWRSSWDVA